MAFTWFHSKIRIQKWSIAGSAVSKKQTKTIHTKPTIGMTSHAHVCGKSYYYFNWTDHFLQATEKFNGYIPIETLQITYSRSSGPGGQNVNKVDTKVDLRFHVNTAEWIPEPIRQKLVASVSELIAIDFNQCEYHDWFYRFQYKNQINKDGYFVIKSELTRYQHMNVADALEKVRNLIRKLEEDSVETQLSPEKLEKIRRKYVLSFSMR